jgi:hypothetical protein
MFRASRGVKRPEIEYMPESEAEKIVDENTLTGETTIKLEFVKVNARGLLVRTERIINRRYYNKLRPRKPDG